MADAIHPFIQGATMNRNRTPFRLPFVAALILLLAACGREGNTPKGPPRPTTSAHYGGGHATTAQLDLTARPVPPPPGPM